MNQLNVVLQLALSPVEEEAFTYFLQNCHNPQADDMHVMYYLERSRYVVSETDENGVNFYPIITHIFEEITILHSSLLNL
jgi:hypothetical protein